MCVCVCCLCWGEREGGGARQEESRGQGGRRSNNATTQQIFQQRDGTPWKKKDGSNTKDETRSVKQVQGKKMRVVTWERRGHVNRIVGTYTAVVKLLL
jgi:hypothetical protein